MEERFERTGCILHVHVGGEVIRTTPEHPFFVQGEGWKQAGALSGGDRIATLSGEWVSVEEVLDTQEWEPVYNLRVAGHHTYFVGDEGWGWAAWAHNRACIEFVQHVITAGSPQVAGFVALAADQRKKWAKRPDASGGSKWRAGDGNIASLGYTGTAGGPTLGMFGSNQTKDAEQNALDRFKEFYPKGIVTTVYTERSMCDDCQTYFREHLVQPNVPADHKIDVYYIIPYVQGQDGSVLLSAYHNLGFTVP